MSIKDKPVIDNTEKDIKAYGIVVGGDYDRKGNYYFAEITPSYVKPLKQILPSVGRWWFEIHYVEKEDTDMLGFGQVTCAYEPGGSGGSYTFRGCVLKAQEAIYEIANREESGEGEK